MGPRAAVGSRGQSPAWHLTRRFRGGGPRVLMAVSVVDETVTWGVRARLVVGGGPAGLEARERMVIGAVRKQVDASLSHRRGEGIWFCSGGFDWGG